MPTQLQTKSAPDTGLLPSSGRATRMLIAGMLIAGLGAAGCGGASHSTTTSTAAAAISKEEFVAKANAICANSDPELSEGAAKLASLHSEAQIAAVVRGTYVPAIEAQIARIRTLGTPAGDQATVKSMLEMALADLGSSRATPRWSTGMRSPTSPGSPTRTG